VRVRLIAATPSRFPARTRAPTRTRRFRATWQHQIRPRSEADPDVPLAGPRIARPHPGRRSGARGHRRSESPSRRAGHRRAQPHRDRCAPTPPAIGRERQPAAKYSTFFTRPPNGARLTCRQAATGRWHRTGGPTQAVQRLGDTSRAVGGEPAPPRAARARPLDPGRRRGRPSGEDANPAPRPPPSHRGMILCCGAAPAGGRMKGQPSAANRKAHETLRGAAGLDHSARGLTTPFILRSRPPTSSIPCRRSPLAHGEESRAVGLVLQHPTPPRN